MRTNLIIERSILHSYPASQLLVSSGCADRLHLVEELRMYCKPRFPLHQCGFLFVLQVAQTIYTTFRTTEAATYAQIHNTDAAETFFGTPVPKVPAPNPGSFPQSAPSHPDLENGLSFSNTDNNDDNDNIGESNNNPSVPLSGRKLPCLTPRCCPMIQVRLIHLPFPPILLMVTCSSTTTFSFIVTSYIFTSSI